MPSFPGRRTVTTPKAVHEPRSQVAGTVEPGICGGVQAPSDSDFRLVVAKASEEGEQHAEESQLAGHEHVQDQ